MQTYNISNTDLIVSRLAYGCMGIGGGWDDAPPTSEEKRSAEQAIQTALDCGINFFDHADIYCRGKSEMVFGEVLQSNPGLRSSIILQTKCGIRFAGQPNPDSPGRYDFSYAHIIKSVEGSLKRLNTDSLDILLLHRPDPLVEPEEVAQAFDELQTAGKVRYFGVSNHTAGQIRLLRKAVRQPLIINQVELSLGHAALLDEGISFNQTGVTSTLALDTLEYCRSKNILLQAWAPVANGRYFSPEPTADTNIINTAVAISKMAVEKNTSPEAIMLAWLLRHPAGIQPIIGTTRPERIRASCLADDVELNREEWYSLFTAARGDAVP